MQKPVPTAKGIADLFDTTSPLKTPVIQRPYAWKTIHVREYLQDLSAAKDAGRYHFLGLIVVDEEGRIHDGQQRLATTFLLIQALKAQLDQCRGGLGEESAAEVNVDGLAAALTRAIQGEKQVAIPPLVIGSGDQAFLVDPTTGVSTSTESAARLVKARGEVMAHLTTELDALPDDSARARALWSWWDFLKGPACVVELSVSSQTASSIFETLNTRGVRLSNGDLVKSYLLATLDEARQSEGMAIWSDITTTLEKETALNEFLLHYWGSHHGEITEPRLFDALKTHVGGKPTVAMRQLKSYQQDAALYAALRNADDPFWRPYGDATIESIRLINALRLTQLRYLLLAILRDYPADTTGARARRAAQADALRWLGAWAIRGVVTRRTGGKPAETAYINTATEVREGSATTLDAIKRLFVDAGRTATDAEFGAEFMKASLNPTATKVVIYAFETLKLGEDAPLGPKPRLTREHVLPQSPDWDTDDWSDFNAQSHADYVDRLGNTLLLMGVTNRELGNKSWKEKKRIIRSKGVPQLPLTEVALKERRWTAKTIERRQEEMAGLALRLWPQ